MRLIEELDAEHRLIEAVAGSLRTYVQARIRGDAAPADGSQFIRFFRLYAGQFHHAREEDTLFVALREHANLPEAGPLATLREDHQRNGLLVDRIEALLALASLDAADAEALDRLATEYSHALWHHIDAEDSVLFPESEARLRKNGVLELPSREMTPEEREAREIGDALVARYPPFQDPTIIRGDGCACCPAILEGCVGLEHAWWSEFEWEELEDHLGEG
jgi:hemerythrin-like domain-containing protein